MPGRLGGFFAADLPPVAQDYVAEFAGVYFEAMSEWFALLRIGETGDNLNEIIRTRLPFEKFGIFLNPGHLIHLDEWLSSPIFPGSQIRMHSGMAMQVDVIPSSSTYFSTRMEDGIVIADRICKASYERYILTVSRAVFSAGSSCGTLWVSR